jgi:hypothetical protein
MRRADVAFSVAVAEFGTDRSLVVTTLLSMLPDGLVPARLSADEHIHAGEADTPRIHEELFPARIALYGRNRHALQIDDDPTGASFIVQERYVATTSSSQPRNERWGMKYSRHHAFRTSVS